MTTIERTVTREVLSHHLETLTNQKDETKFEDFAQGLAERFISPNLRPQTGPVGGGDGKTDSETYPVTTEIASRWYVPDLAGAHERWAFAFSAKKDWRGKVRTDVASIVGTGRGYPRVYFITNQFAPSKDSAAIQDELLAKHQVPVTILDRTWLLESVFDHDSLDIAIDALGVGAGTEHEVRKQGPEDFRRANELETLQKAIGDGTQYSGTTSALAEDCLKAALLARGIERPRYEVEGLFHRAIRVARDNKLESHLLAATYTLAWTSFFWFDDFAMLNALFDEVESLALPSDISEDLERVSNLLQLVRNSVTSGTLLAEAARLETRTESLLKALDRVRADTSRPNNALHAHAISLLTRLPYFMLPHLDVLRLQVNPCEGAVLTPTLEFIDRDGFAVGVVSHAPTLACTTREEAMTFPRWLQEAVVEMFVRFAIPANMDDWATSVLGEENGFSRALTFSHVPNMLRIIFGDIPRLSIGQWTEASDRTFEVRRLSPWQPELQAAANGRTQAAKFGEGAPPESMLNPERMKHSDVQVVTPIDVHKWNAAGWNGVLFASDAPNKPPVLALAFENRTAAEGIFQGFKGRFGPHDPDNALRVAIIRGIYISHPSAYAVIIGPNPEKLPITRDSAVGFVSRINVMRPASSRNLDMFLAEFTRHGRFVLTAAHLPTRESVPELLDGALGKYHLVVREAWQISENDPDAVVLSADDPPVIPPDQPTAPVLKAMAWMEKMRQRERTSRSKP
ncbi:hypothetical protein JJB99_20890 [Bradyrhizobium diazoefficiens]|nr:hypothetical protein JJB99_20890 [Bradyrhizobium diazoefficiens]